jgi:hypothetical protein
VRDGVAVSEIGGRDRAARSWPAGYQPVRNLTGTARRWKVHTPPQIPNYAERGAGTLQGGMVFAIEPFASTGRGWIREAGKAEVFMMVRPPAKAKGSTRTSCAPIESWRGLPIARRYFNHLDREAVEDTLAKLARQGSLVRYPPLVRGGGRDGRAVRALDLPRARWARGVDGLRRAGLRCRSRRPGTAPRKASACRSRASLNLHLRFAAWNGGFESPSCLPALVRARRP